MRLIDADALIEKLEAWKKEAERIDANINYTFASAIIAQVNSEPTIEPERTGRWILVNDINGQHCVCEFCGEWKYHQKQKFCGECGARMEVEHE